MVTAVTKASLFVLLFLLSLSSIASEKTLCCPGPFAYFIPPKGWEIVDANTLESHVKMAFIKKEKEKGLLPALNFIERRGVLNLAVEEVDCTLNEYLSDVKAIYEQNRNTQWRKLGKVLTAAGEAQLTEIDTPTAWGAMRLLQLILLKEGHAYTLTAAAPKRDFCNFYRDFQEAFRSFTITYDLFEPIIPLEKKEALSTAYATLLENYRERLLAVKAPFLEQDFQKGRWMPFRKKVQQEYAEMGSFWQTLVLVHAEHTLRELEEKVCQLKEQHIESQVSEGLCAE